MDPQIFYNFVIGGSGTVFGVLLKVLWDEIKGIHANERQLVDRIAAVEVLVAGKYITRIEFNEAVNRIIDEIKTLRSVVE